MDNAIKEVEKSVGELVDSIDNDYVKGIVLVAAIAIAAILKVATAGR